MTEEACRIRPGQTAGETPTATICSNGGLCPLITPADHLQQRNKDLFGGLYKLEKRLGAGSQGTAWLVCQREKEDLDSQEKHTHFTVKIYGGGDETNHIIREAEVYQALWRRPDTNGFARFHNMLTDVKTSRTGLVLDYVGINLDELFAQCNKNWDISTVAQIWIQLIDRIEDIHSCGYVLCYNKGANLCMEGEDEKTLFMIDLAKAEPYIDENGNHRPCRQDYESQCNSAYTSKRTDKGFLPSRRDDLETAAYAMLCYIDRGSLPWDSTDPPRYIYSMKRSFSNRRLSFENGAIEDYLNCVAKLAYEEQPNYDKLRRQIGTMISYNKIGEFEWLKQDGDKTHAKEQVAAT